MQKKKEVLGMMIFPGNDFMGLQKAGLLEVCYRGGVFAICRVAQWACMAVVVLEDTSMDEDEETRVTLGAWHIDGEFGKKIMEDPNHFAATMLHKDHGKAPDLKVTITHQNNPLEAIRTEVKNRVRKPIVDPVLERALMEHQTRELKAFVDRYGENPQFSPKKVWPGMLMLLLYPFGLPFFYFNKPLWGGIMLGSFVVSLVLPFLLIPAGLLGCVFIVMTLIHVLGNHAKDKEGRMICTQKDQKLILDSISKYKQNLAALSTEDC